MLNATLASSHSPCVHLYHGIHTGPCHDDKHSGCANCCTYLFSSNLRSHHQCCVLQELRDLILINYQQHGGHIRPQYLSVDGDVTLCNGALSNAAASDNRLQLKFQYPAMQCSESTGVWQHQQFHPQIYNQKGGMEQHNTVSCILPPDAAALWQHGHRMQASAGPACELEQQALQTVANAYGARAPENVQSLYEMRHTSVPEPQTVAAQPSEGLLFTSAKPPPPPGAATPAPPAAATMAPPPAAAATPVQQVDNMKCILQDQQAKGKNIKQHTVQRTNRARKRLNADGHPESQPSTCRSKRAKKESKSAQAS